MSYWIAGALLVAILADNRGRSGFMWFILSIFISPFFAGILVLLLGNTNR